MPMEGWSRQDNIDKLRNGGYKKEKPGELSQEERKKKLAALYPQKLESGNTEAVPAYIREKILQRAIEAHNTGDTRSVEEIRKSLEHGYLLDRNSESKWKSNEGSAA